MAQQDEAWESAWKSALGNRSLTPPDGVWDNIEHELNRSRRSRRLIPLGWAAAAAFTVIAVSGVLINDIYTSADNAGAGSKEERLEKMAEGGGGDTSDILAYDKNEFAKEKGDEMIKSSDHQAEDKKVMETFTNEVQRKTNEETSVAPFQDQQNKQVYDFLPALLDNMKAALADLKLPEVPEIWGVPAVVKKDGNNGSSAWQAGLSFSAGSSSSQNVLSGSSMDAFYEANDPGLLDSYNQTSGLGSIKSYGMSLGKKIAKKVVLESGITYWRLENTGQSNLAYVSSKGRATYNLNAQLSSSQLTTTTPYEVQHVHQFISVPVKAGYLLMDKKWKVAVTAGIAGDYFIKTHTEDLTGNLQRYEANPSTDPQWNSMTVSMTGGMNISRQLGDHYIIAISPEARQALSDFSNTRNDLQPFILQMAIQLKYKF